ncbi:MAG: hypothetical protein DI639_09710 [Leifsonia xyli]|nr:MAG: hypothetical protein DI639_09710 [Leifsonia xyli]
MQDASAAISRYRAAQFRQALRERGLDPSDASVRRVHDFDSALRSVTLDLSERIELALRGHLDALGAARFGSHWYLDRRAFRDTFDHRALLRHARAALDRTADPAIRSAWQERRFERVPFGMLAEELSLGELSRLTCGLEPAAAPTTRDSGAAASGSRRRPSAPPPTWSLDSRGCRSARRCTPSNCSHTSPRPSARATVTPMPFEG